MLVDFEQIALKIRKRIYKYIGSGSGRYVFDLGNGYVVKVAVNRKGFAQNKAEHEIASTDRSNIFAKIMQYSDDFEFVIMEKADKIQSISEVCKYFNAKNSRELFQLQMFRNLSSQYDLILPDLNRSENWGKINGRPVIIDYGFTRRVKKKYYSRFRFF